MGSRENSLEGKIFKQKNFSRTFDRKRNFSPRIPLTDFYIPNEQNHQTCLESMKRTLDMKKRVNFFIIF